MAYRNTTRPAMTSSTSIHPRMVEEDISEDIRTLEPESTPIISMMDLFKTGSAPKSHKVMTIQQHMFDHFDYCTNYVQGPTGFERFARIQMTQPSRPDLQNIMFYQPQDMLYIQATNQHVEVVMTPTSSIAMDHLGNNRLSLPTALTGGTATTSAPGTIVVRHVSPVAPMIPIPTAGSWAIYMSRTIHESAMYGGMPHRSDYIYDCNFVEHKEASVIMTEDQWKWVKTKGKKPEWNRLQEEEMKIFKKSIEYAAVFGERSVDLTIPDRPRRTMRGLFNAIQTNVTVYNPNAIMDFENMFLNFCLNSGFRYNPNGKKKVLVAGEQFLVNFNRAFKQYVRTTGKEKSFGLAMDTYILPDGTNVKITTSEILRRGTPMENWCFVIDPAEAEPKMIQNFTTKLYANPNERDVKLGINWQGTIAWHREQSHALLRTV